MRCRKYPHTLFLLKIFLAMFVLFTSLMACTPARAPNEKIEVKPEIIKAAGKYKKQYILVAGDRIEVSVWQVPEVSRTVVVRPDGYISLPTVSAVKAAGLTFEELEGVLRKRLSERLRDPNVTIIAVDIRQSMVYVVGDVGAQRAVPLHQATTALEAITLAGGFVRSGAKKDVSIIRIGDDGVLRAIPIDVFSGSQPSPYIALSVVQLQADDIVFVPETGRSETIRFLDDFIGRPLSYINLVGSTVINYRIIKSDNL